MARRLMVGAAFAALTACGGGGAADRTGPDPAGVGAVTVSPISVAIAVGGTYQLTVSVTDASGVPVGNMPLVYGTSDPAIATVSPSGLVTAVGVGAATITVAVTDQGVTRSATCRVTVTAARGPNAVDMVGTSFVPQSLTIASGDSVSWHFAGAVHNVTFTGAAPPGGSIPDQQPGVAVSRQFPTAGTYAYECTRHSGMTGQVLVQSGAPQNFSALRVTPTTPSIALGGRVQLSATPLDQNGTPMAGLPAPGFTSGAPDVAAVGPAGLVTGASAGTAVITASLSTSGVTHTATATVTVTVPQPGSVTVTTPDNTFSPPTVTITAGGTVTWQFSGSTHNVTFTGTAPAGGNIPDQDPGNAASRLFAAAGTYGYACTRHNGMTGQVVVQAGGPQTYSSLTLEPAAVSVGVGGTTQLTATPRDQNGLPIAGLPAPTLGSTDTSVVTVSATGLVTGVAPGTARVIASLMASGAIHADTSTVTVTVAQPGDVTVTTPGNTFSPDRIEIAVGRTVTWQFSGAVHNVTFVDAAPPGGNIPDALPGTSASRTFPAEGDYEYGCTLHPGMSGRVRVR